MKKKSWASNEPSELVALVDELYREDQDAKKSLARVWEENIRFIEGDQYIKYNAQTRNYEPIPSRVDGEMMPKGIDNQLYVRCDIARSNLTRQDPIFNVTPNSSDPKDERLAKVALAVHDSRSELDKDREKRGELADWGVATGNAILKTALVPAGKIPVTTPDGKAELDENGNTQMATIGDIETIVVSPLRFGIDKKSVDLRYASKTIEYSVQRLVDVKEWYGVQGPGYTGEAVNLAPEEISEDNILKIEESLKDYKSGKPQKSLEECVILKEVFVKPDEEIPNGRMVVCANGKLLFADDSPYAKLNPKVWHPYDHFRYKSQPGKFWGITPTTMGVKLQRRLNAIDTMVALHRQTMALGQWLIPRGSIKEGGVSGRVGLKIEYTTGPKGEKPEKINGTEIGQSIILERQEIIKAMDAIFGTTDILQGKPPGDLTSGVSLELVREMSFSRFNPMYQQWEIFHEGSAQKRLSLIARKQTADNPVFTSLLRNKLRTLTGLDISQFVGSMIQDNTNIRITAGSTVPKSQAAKLANLMKFGEAGLLGDLIQDPFRNQTFLNAFDIDDFKTESNVDFEKTKHELGQIEAGEMPVVNPKDDHRLHNQYFLTKLKDPQWYSSRPPEVVQAAWHHFQEHEMAIQQEQKEAQSNQRLERDENAYVQALVNSGGPEGNPPTLDLFPSAIEDKFNLQKQAEAPMGAPSLF